MYQPSKTETRKIIEVRGGIIATTTTEIGAAIGTEKVRLDAHITHQIVPSVDAMEPKDPSVPEGRRMKLFLRNVRYTFKDR